MRDFDCCAPTLIEAMADAEADRYDAMTWAETPSERDERIAAEADVWDAEAELDLDEWDYAEAESWDLDDDAEADVWDMPERDGYWYASA